MSLSFRNTQRLSAGFTLVEMIVVLSIMSIIAIVVMNRTILAHDHQAARAAGNNLYQYINAVRNYIANTPALPPGVYNGVNWLQGPGCGGGAPVDYYPCGWPNQPGFGLNYVANVANVAGSITVTLNMGPVVYGGVPRGDIAGLMARVANAEDSGLIAGATSFFNVTSDPVTSILTIVVRNDTGTDPFLRVDGTNTMNADINFNAAALNRNINNAQALNGERVNLTIEANAPIYRDSDDPLNFFVDPNGVSNLNNITMNNAAGGNINSIAALTVQTQGGNTLNLNPGAGGGDVIVGGGGGTGIVRAQDVFVTSRGAFLSDILPRYSHRETFLVTNGAVVPKPPCVAPSVPRIVITLQESRTDPLGNPFLVTHVSAADAGATWTAYVGSFGVGGFIAGGQALAQTYCFFP